MKDIHDKRSTTGNAMLTAEAKIETERPSRYLVQLCQHATKMAGTRGHRPRRHGAVDALERGEVRIDANWTETHGIVTFDPWGQCTIQGTPDALMVRVEATDEENLRRIQDIITRDLERMSQRDDLTVDWHRPAAPNGEPSHGPEA